MPANLPRGLYILGLGGHGRSVADAASEIGVKNLVFVDPNPAVQAMAGFVLLRSLPDQIEDGWAIFPAIGDNGIRKTMCADHTGRLATLVSRSASIGLRAEIGRGTFVGRHAHVGPFARIGVGVIVNTAAVVEHDCEVGDFSHVSVNATLAGKSRIGSNVMIGAGATVIDGVGICDNVTVGAGATVVRNIEQAGTYVGTPAKPLS
ncbi:MULTISPECIES: acetyltransferase [unclassified Mesorhizobium]|uniref:acetyltransferase n=1 Tax=unclassified Mesorhizobium TaxID=325217 RepID=UPI0024151E46|nr:MULTISPECIES: acetyltransferase [unclassified Mesorhizobium]MDG4854513.1 acetyltransferase [Mesorhizobium sp. WSM4982]MDG4916010.1 acetyltransferase [Mesorhizobium sp. WSM4983]